MSGDQVPPAWPGDARSTVLRAAWHRTRHRISQLEDVARGVAADLERARAELAKIEAAARGAAPIDEGAR